MCMFLGYRRVPVHATNLDLVLDLALDLALDGTCTGGWVRWVGTTPSPPTHRYIGIARAQPLPVPTFLRPRALLGPPGPSAHPLLALSLRTSLRTNKGEISSNIY